MFDIPHDQLARAKQLEEMKKEKEQPVGWYGWAVLGYAKIDEEIIEECDYN